MEKVKCPICNQKATIYNTFDYGRVKWYECELCGFFKLEGSIFEIFDFKNYDKRNKLTFAIRQIGDKSNPVDIDSIEKLDEIINEVNYPQTIMEKVDEIIKFLFINEMSTSGLAISTDNGLIFGIETQNMLDLVIKLSEAKHYLKFDPKFASGGGFCQIESEGILRYEEIMNITSNNTKPNKDINPDLINDTQNLLRNYPKAENLFNSALEKYNKNIYERNLLDDMRLALELFLKNVLNNNKSLENQKSEIGTYQKNNNASPELSNMFIKLVDYYAKYHNSNIKHNDNIKKNEIGFIINLTSSFIMYFS